MQGNKKAYNPHSGCGSQQRLTGVANRCLRINNNNKNMRIRQVAGASIEGFNSS